MIAEQFIDYLVAQSKGTKGGDLFLGFLPESPDNVTVVRDATAPQLAESQMHPIGQTGIHILARHENQLSARARCFDLYEILRTFRLAKFTASGNTVTYTVCTTPPSYIGPDEKNRHTWTTYFNIRYQL